MPKNLTYLAPFSIFVVNFDSYIRENFNLSGVKYNIICLIYIWEQFAGIQPFPNQFK